MDIENAALVEQAKAILDLNWTGEYTQPGPRLYPHQWSWDSALVALAYAHYERRHAAKELRHLFEAQWEKGLLPQIVFNPRFQDYFPGPGFWPAKASPLAPKHRKTSGVALPPVHATAVLRLYQRAEGGEGAKAFLGYAFRKLTAWHEYLYRDRDPQGEGLVYIRHPWESGMDNSPVWDAIMQRMHLRADQIPEYRRAATRTDQGRLERHRHLVGVHPRRVKYHARMIFSVVIWPPLEADGHDSRRVHHQRVKDVMEAFARGAAAKV